MQQEQQFYENFKQAVMIHYMQTSSIEQKKQSFEFLQQFDSDPKQWIICAQLIIEQDQMLQFFGYKYVYNILVYMPNLISQNEYELIQQKIINNIFSNMQSTQQQFLINKQFQVLIQMVFQQIIQLDGLFNFCLNGIQNSMGESAWCSILKLLYMLFEQLNNSKIHYKKLTYQFKKQMEEYIKQNIDITPLIESICTILNVTQQQEIQKQAIQTLNQLIKIYLQQQMLRLNNQCVSNIFQCYIKYCTQFQNNIAILQDICEGILSIFNIVGLQVRQETYQQIMFLFHKIIQTIQKQQYTEQFLQFFILSFAPQICQPQVFKALINQQLQQFGPQIGKDNYLISSKAQNDAFDYFNKGIILSDNKNEGYLFYLIYTMLLVQSIPDNPDIFIPIQQFFDCLIQNSQALSNKFCKDFIKQLMPLCLKKIIYALQRPTTLKYYYNPQGYLERNDNNEYEDDQQYVEKLRIIDLLYNVNKQLFKQLIQQLIDDIIKEQNIFLLQQLSIIYPKICQLNQEIASQIIFMVLSFKSQIFNQNTTDKDNIIVLINQMFLYMIKFNKTLLQDHNFAIQVMQQCFGIFMSDASYQLYEYAFETVNNIIIFYCGKNNNQDIIMYLKNEVLANLFQLANSRLTIFQIQDLYSAILNLMPDYQREILEPVQQYSHQNLQQLITNNVMLQNNEQNALVQLFSVLESIMKVIGRQLIESWLKEDIIQIANMFHNQQIVNDTLNCHIDVLLQIICNQQSDIIQLLDKRNSHLNQLLQNDAEIQNSDISYLIIYQNLLENLPDTTLNNPEDVSLHQMEQTVNLKLGNQYQLCIMLMNILQCLISYQKRKGVTNINPYVQQSCAIIMEIFLRESCKLYQRYLLKDEALRTQFLNCLISIATSQELAGGEFISLYKRQRSYIEVFIFRRAGEQFLKFALQSLKTIIGEMGVKVLSITGEYFILDLLKQSLSIVGAQNIAQLLGNIDPNIVSMINSENTQQQNEALHDILVCIGANER